MRGFKLLLTPKLVQEKFFHVNNIHYMKPIDIIFKNVHFWKLLKIEFSLLAFDLEFPI